MNVFLENLFYFFAFLIACNYSAVGHGWVSSLK